MSWAEFEVEVQGRMTPELALVVRRLRADQGNSWRGVSGEVFSDPAAEPISDWIEMQGHQPLGMYLCQAAARLLGEDPDREPWN